jgi:uncharacterized protein DUF2752
MKVLFRYFTINRVIYGFLLLYGLGIMLNALGIHLWLPGCLITQYTGYECLGCGINRAAIALLSGDVHSAFILNPLIFIYIPIAMAWIANDFYKFYSNNN